METPDSFTEKRLSDAKNTDHFIVEDLLDFPSDENMVAADGVLEAAMAGASTDSSTVDNSSSFSNSQAAGNGGLGEEPFSGELCVPYDEVAELEWLSNFVDESFSNEDLQRLHLIQGIKARPVDQHSLHPQTSPTIPSEMSVPAKARSKRSRAAPGNWTSRLLAVAPPPTAHRKKESQESPGEGRRCIHCATDKTPQWRTGPMGPKTLCNACGVRYKSGRLVPEYRPASSPTFVLSKHSNSHRKVLELRRQKEVLRAQQHLLHHQPMVFDVSNSDDYFIPYHIGADYRHMI